MKIWLFALVAALTLSACGAVPPAPDSTQSSSPAPDLPQSTSPAPDSTQSVSPAADSPLPVEELPAAPEQTPAPLPSEGLTDADARRIALEHAGLSENDVAFIRTNKERDNGRMEYEIEFSSGAIKYDYTIDAETGALLSFEADDAEENVTLSFDAADAPPSVIGQDEAKAVALAHAGVSETDASRLKIELDRDDGRAKYEVEFYAGRVEYSYDIDAASGEILSFEMDND